eukprot:241859_1
MSSALLFTFNDDTISKTAPVSLHDLTFDEILKFINTPKYNKHSFLREECMNNNNTEIMYGGVIIPQECIKPSISGKLKKSEKRRKKRRRKR